jgi:hypothetical protein
MINFYQHSLNKYYILITKSFYIYLDFPHKVSPCLLIPVAGEFFLELLTSAVLKIKDSIAHHLCDQESVITKLSIIHQNSEEWWSVLPVNNKGMITTMTQSWFKIYCHRSQRDFESGRTGHNTRKEDSFHK